MLGVLLPGTGLVLDAAPHVVRHAGGFGEPGDAFSNQGGGDAAGDRVVRGLEGGRGDELPDDGRGDDSAPGSVPLLRPLDEVVQDGKSHGRPHASGTAVRALFWCEVTCAISFGR